MSPTATERWAPLCGVELADAEEAAEARDVPGAIERLCARTHADPHALAATAKLAMSNGFASAGNVGAIALKSGLLLYVAERTARLDARAVAHEMANAITAISGWAELVRGAPSHAMGPRLAALDSAIADAMDTARALLEKDRAPVSLVVGELCRRVASGLEPYARTRGVAITVEAADIAVEQAVPKLRSIVQNLVKNAVEASPRGQTVEVAVERARGGARIVVRDRGPGMGGPSRPDGHGVGLGLVQRIGREIGVQVHWDTRPGGGTEATVSMRRQSAELAATRPRPKSEPRIPRDSGPAPARKSAERLRRHRVLLVEDETALAEMMRSALLIVDADVTTVATPAELAALDDETTFDAALVDLRLEHGDPGTGLSALANLLERGLARRVVLTSGAPPEKLPPGVDYVLPKPFDLDALLQALLPSRAFKAAARVR